MNFIYIIFIYKNMLPFSSFLVLAFINVRGTEGKSPYPYETNYIDGRYNFLNDFSIQRNATQRNLLPMPLENIFLRCLKLKLPNTPTNGQMSSILKNEDSELSSTRSFPVVRNFPDNKASWMNHMKNGYGLQQKSVDRHPNSLDRGAKSWPQTKVMKKPPSSLNQFGDRKRTPRKQTFPFNLTFNKDKTHDIYVYNAIHRNDTSKIKENHLVIVKVPKGATGKIPLKNIHIIAQGNVTGENGDKNEGLIYKQTKISSSQLPYFMAKNKRESYLVIPIDKKNQQPNGPHEIIIPFNETIPIKAKDLSNLHQHKRTFSQSGSQNIATIIEREFGPPKMDDILENQINEVIFPQLPELELGPTPQLITDSYIYPIRKTYEELIKENKTEHRPPMPVVLPITPQPHKANLDYDDLYYLNYDKAFGQEKPKKKWPSVRVQKNMRRFPKGFPFPSKRLPAVRKFKHSRGMNNFPFPFNVLEKSRQTFTKEIPAWIDSKLFASESVAQKSLMKPTFANKLTKQWNKMKHKQKYTDELTCKQVQKIMHAKRMKYFLHNNAVFSKLTPSYILKYKKGKIKYCKLSKPLKLYDEARNDKFVGKAFPHETPMRPLTKHVVREDAQVAPSIIPPNYYYNSFRKKENALHTNSLHNYKVPGNFLQ